ncbi:OLC1v1024285C1 [Oldenlandia corymbosa var. corymbosa]|uniref:OLC1v1024285C1 n=1 Tax=Oldenlandia corymbosa var. corymbosa TaxID=529605 RepID=A0AAV1C4E9_OLDCO|nr:OLC1v1024285C1 [Oldenlandia corymbosa var. corymbosa]
MRPSSSSSLLRRTELDMDMVVAEEGGVWDSLRTAFPDDSNGSRIFLTSRHGDVALKIKPDSQLHHLRLLNDDESWELLQKSTFFGEGCHPELLKHGLPIAKYCKRLPLMILIVGGLLPNIEPDTWKEVEESLEKGTLFLIEQCRKSLELRIPQQTESECLADVARSYMMDLIQRNLVIVGQKGSRAKHIISVFTPGEEKNMQRTLLIDDHSRCRAEYWYNVFYRFWQSKLLRVLDLRTITVGDFFLIGVDLLLHLRYLALKIQAEGVTIPSSVANLSSLETFIVDAIHANFSPSPISTIWTMKRLKHLCLTSCAYQKSHDEDPDYSSNSKINLESLSTIQFSCVQEMNEVLRKFPKMCRLNCSFLNGDTEDCTTLALDVTSQLKSLSIFSGSKGGIQNLNFEFPQNLRKLTLSGFRLPWSKISAIDGLPHLEVLKLLKQAFSGEECEAKEGKFRTLRYLKMSDMDLARWIAPEYDSFPCLEIISNGKMPAIAGSPDQFSQCFNSSNDRGNWLRICRWRDRTNSGNADGYGK